MLRLKFLAISFFICSSVIAQEKFPANVFVSDFNDNPLINAQVKLLDTTGVLKYSGITGQDGKFDLQISTGKYRIQLLQDGQIKKDKYIILAPLEGRRIYHQVRIHVLYEERTTFTIENLLFEYNSAEIYAESYPILNKLVDYLLNHQDDRFEIGGHTDAIGTDADNLVLSQNRANAVRDYLIAHGVPEEQITAVGYGESVPVADNDSDEGRAKNRRTELKKLE